MIDKILDKLSLQEKNFLSKEIFAPYVNGGNKIRVRIDGVVYQLKAPKFKKDGFGVFKAINSNKVKFVREAESFEIDQYLQLLPRVDAILIFKSNRWLATPSNKSDFKKRFGRDGLFSVLVADNVEILDTVQVRFDGSCFWFDSAKIIKDMDKREDLRQRIIKGNYSMTKELKYGLSPEEDEAFNLACQFHKEANMSDLEKRLTNEFGRYDATMERFVERGSNVEVQWRDNISHQAITSVFNKEDLSVVTAGICLSGGDKKFDLQSMVGVFREASNSNAIVHVGAGGMDDSRYWDMYDNNDWNE